MYGRALGLIGTVTVFVTAANGQPFGGFAPQQSYAVGNGPREVAVADLNGDGALDLATANAVGDSISILLGNGDGTFAAATTYPAGDLPLTIEAADLDSDGDMDLTVCNGNVPGFSVLFGNGDGTFVTQQTIVFDIDAEPYPGVFMSHTMADFDGDGDIDIAVQSLTANVLMIMPNDGTGAFGSFQVVYEDTSFNFPTDVEPADLDGDGDIDLVETVGNTFVRVYLNNGDATFAPVSEFAMAGHDIMAPLADLNGDGFIDIATNSTVDPGGYISIAYGIGDGTFGAVTTSLVNRPSGITASDIDGDGFVDLAVTSYAAFNSVSVMFGSEEATFGSLQAFAAGGNNPEGIVAADLNGDSWPDLVTTNRGGNNVSIFINLTESPGPTCPVDLNESGTADVPDIFLFLSLWFADDPAADFDELNGVTVPDIFAFLTAWFAGCP